ncbi:MAG: SpoIIE family protein phosphatase, partial [Candidatus Rifleibacteriota bacterium]
QQEFKNNFKIDLNFYLFDQNNQLIKSSPNQPPHLWLMKNLYPALAEKKLDQMPSLAKKLDKKVQFAFGYGKDLISIKENPERIIQTVFENQEGILTWTAREKGGLIIYAPRLAEPEKIFLFESLRFRRTDGLSQAGIIKESAMSLSNALPARAYNHLLKSDRQIGEFAGKNWAFLKAESGRIFFANFNSGCCPFKHFRHLMRQILAILALAIISMIIFSKAALSLKSLLISMFFASSMIPLLGIAVTSIDNLDVYQQIEAQRIKAQQESTLGNIAQNFSTYLASCSATLSRLTQQPGSSNSDPATAKLKLEILKFFPDAKITLKNSAGENLYYFGPMVSQGRETVFKSLARKLVERYAPDRLDECRYNGNPFSDSMVNQDDMGFGTLLNYPDMLQLVNTGNSELFLYYRVLPSSAGKTAIVFVELSIFQTIKNYLKSLNQQRFNLENTSMQIASFFPNGYRWSLPPGYDAEQPLLRLAEETWLTGQSKFEKFSDKLTGYASAIKFSALPGNCLLAFCKDDRIKESISRMNQRLIFGTLAALILLVSVVLWLYRQLLSPLKSLGHGVNALAQRKFETRLPELPGKDELAGLFTAFNDMMAESYDMQIARNVQEGLVPQTFPQLNDYSVHGILREASELGGDCLDCFMIDENKMLFLIGDITGHGVGSALIMAFSRAVTFHWSQSPEHQSPATLADQLDLMLRRNKTSRMFMGIICGTLDISTGQVELVVKGHIYPLLAKKDGSKQWVGIPAYPLGIGKKSQARSICFKLETGDRLLCITDGILESSSAGKTLGFEGIEKWADEIVEENAKDWVLLLEEKYRQWSNFKQHDDISIFGLIRNLEKKP